MVSFYPEDSQPAAANKLLGSLLLIVAQKLARSVDGNVVAIRSWLVLDREAKKLLSETQFYKWGALVTDLLETRGTSFDKQAILLLQSETISLPTFMKVTGIDRKSTRLNSSH